MDVEKFLKKQGEIESGPLDLEMSNFCENFDISSGEQLYFVYCNNCVLNDFDGTCYCTGLVVALRKPEICFWPAKTRRNLNFLRCIHVFDLVLKYCSDINEGN